jgi:phage shock protein A
MAIRVQRLEDTCQRIEALLTRMDDRLRKVEIDVAEMRGRIAQLPSTWAMITTMLGGQVAFAAAILAILKVTGAR